MPATVVRSRLLAREVWVQVLSVGQRHALLESDIVAMGSQATISVLQSPHLDHESREQGRSRAGCQADDTKALSSLGHFGRFAPVYPPLVEWTTPTTLG